MNEKFYLGYEENFEAESLMIENGVKPPMSINDLSDAEKAEFFNDPIDLKFAWKEAMESCR
jgi:hypothetical protein